jgi:hypothetical protein
LPADSSLVFQLAVSAAFSYQGRNSVATGRAQLKIRTFSAILPPPGSQATVSIIPAQGQSLKDRFTIMSQGWATDQGTLPFAFKVQRSRDTEEQALSETSLRPSVQVRSRERPVSSLFDG